MSSCENHEKTEIALAKPEEATCKEFLQVQMEGGRQVELRGKQ